jgi:hypothetical protein
MSFHSWLRNLRSALAPCRGQRHHRRRAPLRAATHRLNIEALEDRSVPAFIAPVDYTVGAYPIGMQAGDFNGDGIPDVVTVNAGATGVNGSVSVLLSNGDGTFQPARNTPTAFPYGYGPNALAVGDFDRDGKLDLATSGVGSDPNYPYPVGGFYVLLGRGDGTFVSTFQPGSLGGAYAIATGDMDGDGNLDLVETVEDYSTSTYVAVLWGRGDGTFDPAPYTDVNSYTEVNSLALADFDGDKKLDLVLGGYSRTLILLGDGTGYFQTPRDLGLATSDLTVADFNADGKPDLAAYVIGSDSWRLSVLLGNGDGSFQTERPFTAAGGSVTVADVNGDRALDLVLGGGNVLLGTGDGSFGPPITTAATGTYLVVADFNVDGRPDEALTQTTSATTVTVLFNDGAWSLDNPPSVSIRDTAVTEGNTGMVNATFSVTLSHAWNADVTVHYATADITATAGSDYTVASGDVTIPAGQTSATVTVPVRGDRLGEANETFAVNLSASTNATIGDGQGIGTILDDEPRISISDVTKSEGRKGKTLFTFTVTLSAAYDQPVTVSFQTVNGTATTGDNDYVARADTLTFAPGETTKTVTIEVKGDSKREADETFFLDLFGNSGNSWFTRQRGVGTILNDD